MFRDSIPAICYHRVEINESITPKIFESHLEFLSGERIKTLSSIDLINHLNGSKKLQGKSIMLTFDDGYADFYQNVFPLLRKYQAKAMVFLIGNYVVSDPKKAFSNSPLQYNDIHKMAAKGDYQGFLSLEQILEMKESGLVEYGGHTMTHTVSIKGPEITGIFKGQKMKWYTEHFQTTEYGNPMFRIAPAMAGPEFIPNPDYEQAFRKLSLKNRLSFQEIENALSNISKGEFENNESWQARQHYELVDARKKLESLIGQQITAFCWPWGEENPEVIEYLRKTGFTLAFTLYRGSNVDPGDALSIKRFSARNKGPKWLNSRLRVFSSSLLSSYYKRRSRTTKAKYPSLPYY